MLTGTWVQPASSLTELYAHLEMKHLLIISSTTRKRNKNNKKTWAENCLKLTAASEKQQQCNSSSCSKKPHKLTCDTDAMSLNLRSKMVSLLSREMREMSWSLICSSMTRLPLAATDVSWNTSSTLPPSNAMSRLSRWALPCLCTARMGGEKGGA